MAVTIKDVAKLAGVSTATVSYVINSTNHVSEETRQRVTRAVEKLEYRPSALARSLRVQRTRTIGLIIPRLDNQFFTEAAHGIEDVLRNNHYSLVISESEDSPLTEKKLIQVFNSLLVDGLVMAPCRHRQSELRELLRGNYPTVFFDRRPTRFESDAVVLDNYSATRKAITYLIERGHSRIGMVLGPNWFSTTRDRMRAYKRALRDAGIEFDSALVRNGDYGVEAGSELSGDLIKRAGVTALFPASANMTLGAFIKIREMGLSVPRDVAIIGCDDNAWASATDPAITMLYQPAADMGRKAAELLLKRIESPADGYETVYLPPEMRIRSSV
ncbi:MAG: LacI family transcriptional regulator [Planctomycetota bacterium]|jgi:DNA-binding LacI/PurR family transcriptional regulator|nr:LacI family transcriptional regulator [Planctomycetota bacterium]